MPNVVTLPQHFKNHGYHAECIGKIYHDGRSFRDAPSWSVPEQLAFTGEVREAALSQFPRPAFGRRTHMGYSIRTDRYRYTEWRPLKTGDIAARELYDHGNDPNETVNLAEQTAHAETVERLQGKLRELTRR
jgi:arylsulfatase A-like enzyme